MAVRSKVKMPRLGDTAGDVLVIEWHVQVGADIRVGDPLITVETDKVDAEVPTPVDGRLMEQLVRPNDEVSTGMPIAVIETG